MDIQLTASYTDQYQLAMGQAYYLNNQAHTPAIFDYYFRKIPYEGGYVIFSGLADLLKTIEQLRFSQEDIEWLLAHGFDKSYVKTLENFRFTGSLYAPKEGSLVFPTEPIIRIEGSILETQLIETLLLNILNFQSLIATKAARIRSVASQKTISEFGLRRAQGLGAMAASRAAIIGGADSTSNVAAAQHYGLNSSGTMAHSFVQMHDSELEAFRKFATTNPKNCVLLVDTYNTLTSGVPNAIKVAKEMEERGERLLAVRIDSGDLSYLARKTRQQLDAAGLSYVQIAASNQLDEYVVRSLLHQNAPIDIFGIGTNLAIGKPNGALDGVYKLVMAGGKPRIKVSESIKKTTLPGKKQVYRMYTKEGLLFGADAIAESTEGFPSRMIDPFDAHKSMSCKDIISKPLLEKVMDKGRIVNLIDDIDIIKKEVQEQLQSLPPEYKRFENPHVYKVGISEQIKTERDELFRKYLK